MNLPVSPRLALALLIAALAQAQTPPPPAADLPAILDCATYTTAGEYHPLAHAKALARIEISVQSGEVKLRPQLAPKLPLARENPPAVRRAALRLAGTARLLALIPAALQATEETEPPEVRTAAMEALGKLGGDEAKDRLVALAGEGEPAMRTAAVVALTDIDLSEAARQASGNLLAADANPDVIATLLPAFLAHRGGSPALAISLAAQSPPPLPKLAQAMLEQMQALDRHDPELTAALTRFASAGKASGAAQSSPPAPLTP